MRLQQCDTVFLFDMPTELCIQGFENSSLPRIYELIEKYREGRQVLVFKSRDAADDFISKLLKGEQL